VTHFQWNGPKPVICLVHAHHVDVPGPWFFLGAESVCCLLCGFTARNLSSTTIFRVLVRRRQHSERGDRREHTGEGKSEGQKHPPDVPAAAVIRHQQHRFAATSASQVSSATAEQLGPQEPTGDYRHHRRHAEFSSM
jgi:hypothetical protein